MVLNAQETKEQQKKEENEVSGLSESLANYFKRELRIRLKMERVMKALLEDIDLCNSPQLLQSPEGERVPTDMEEASGLAEFIMLKQEIVDRIFGDKLPMHRFFIDNTEYECRKG